MLFRSAAGTDSPSIFVVDCFLPVVTAGAAARNSLTVMVVAEAAGAVHVATAEARVFGHGPVAGPGCIRVAVDAVAATASSLISAVEVSTAVRKFVFVAAKAAAVCVCPVVAAATASPSIFVIVVAAKAASRVHVAVAACTSAAGNRVIIVAAAVVIGRLFVAKAAATTSINLAGGRSLFTFFCLFVPNRY